jgi:hypothetical protein
MDDLGERAVRSRLNTVYESHRKLAAEPAGVLLRLRDQAPAAFFD